MKRSVYLIVTKEFFMEKTLTLFSLKTLLPFLTIIMSISLCAMNQPSPGVIIVEESPKSHGPSKLMLAARRADLEDVKRLIHEKGEKVNYQDSEGWTALMELMTCGATDDNTVERDKVIEVAEYLKKNGADTQLKNKKEQTAKQLALKYDLRTVASYLN